MLAPVSAKWTPILIFVSLCSIIAIALYGLYTEHPVEWSKHITLSQPSHKPSSTIATSTLSKTTQIVEEATHIVETPTHIVDEPTHIVDELTPAATTGRVYKNATDRPLHSRPFIPFEEKFPLAAHAKSSRDIPPIPAWNKSPWRHVSEKTPLFIGFTRNWLLLQQTVVSFLTAGWPPEDIYVVENTGVMDANQKKRLTEQNPSYIDYHRLKNIFKVNVITTPSLQSFAQLQNLYLYEALKNNWPQYFWSHMDILVQSAEDVEPYRSFYLKAVDAIRESRRNETLPQYKPWALRYFAYDWVTLMNTAAMVKLGGWDSLIGYYTTDCDMYERKRMMNMSTNDTYAGPVYDTGESLPDLAALYRQGDTRGSETWMKLQQVGKNMTH